MIYYASNTENSPEVRGCTIEIVQPYKQGFLKLNMENSPEVRERTIEIVQPYKQGFLKLNMENSPSWSRAHDWKSCNR